jgi:hypothetical protein
LYRSYISNPSLENKSRFTTYRNKLKSLLRIAEKQYYAELFTSCKDDLAATWKNIKSILHGLEVSELPKMFLQDGKPVLGSKNIADSFNDYFTNIGSTLAAKIPPVNVSYKKFMPKSSCNSFSFLPSDAAEIITICSNLKNKKSAGHDGVIARVVKCAITSIVNPLCAIINCSFDTGIVPDDIKVAKIVPVYKSGPKDIFSNYRPISILPFFSKLFEKLVYDRLLAFLNKHDVLSPNQYGFRKGCSTYMAIIDMCDKISESIDNGACSAGIFIDLSKAFDTVNHSILVSKLEHYGIRGIAKNWFVSYLSSRYQYVSIEDADSEKALINCGVPQGSILGPLLFLIYINDITNCAKFLKFILFADDTNLFYSAKNLIELESTINSELASLADWFGANKLSLNIDKTSYMLFGSKKSETACMSVSLSINEISIKQVENCKFLGVYLDNNLTWDKHIQEISSKISRSIGVISKLSYKLPRHILFNLYNTMILPYLSYCNIVWGINYPTHLEKLNLLQKRIVRVMCGRNRSEHTAPLFNHLKLLKVTDINILQTSVFMYKIYNHQISSHFSNYFYLNSDVHQHYTRSHQNYHLCTIRTNIRKFSIKFHGPSVYNNIPDDIKILQPISRFKKSLKQHLLLNYV